MLTILKSTLLLTLTAASNIHGLFNGPTGHGHQIISSDGGASISWSGSGPPPAGLSITPVHGSGFGGHGCGAPSMHRGASSALQTTNQAKLNKIFSGSTPPPEKLAVSLQGTDQRDAMDEMDAQVCTCGGIMLYDTMTLQHIDDSKGSFESTLTWRGTNDQDYIHVAVRNGAIVKTIVSLCPDNDGMTMPTVVEYSHDDLTRGWVYKSMKGSMQAGVGDYKQHSASRPVPEGGLKIARDMSFRQDITDSFIPVQQSAGHTLGSASSSAPPAIMDAQPGEMSAERVALMRKLQELKERLSKGPPGMRMTPGEIEKDKRVQALLAQIALAE